MNRKLLIISMLLLIFTCGCSDNETEFYFPESSVAAVPMPSCHLNQTNIALFPAQDVSKSTPTYFNTTEYEILLGDGAYLGKYYGSINNTFLNFTYGDQIEILTTTKDCFAYKTARYHYIICESMKYIVPKLKCADKFEYHLYDRDDTLLEEINNTLIESTNTRIKIKIDEYSKFQYLTCVYDRAIIRDIQMEPELFEREGRFQYQLKIDSENYDIPVYKTFELNDDNDEYKLHFEIMPILSAPYNTTVYCTFLDGDLYIRVTNDRNEIVADHMDADYNDVGQANPVFNLTIRGTGD